MKKNNVVINCIVQYNCTTGSYYANVRARIKVDKRTGFLPLVLTNEKTKFFDSYLRPSWGHPVSILFREKIVYFSDKDLSSLDEKISNYVNNELKKISNVKKMNIERECKNKYEMNLLI